MYVRGQMRHYQNLSLQELLAGRWSQVLEMEEVVCSYGGASASPSNSFMCSTWEIRQLRLEAP